MVSKLLILLWHQKKNQRRKLTVTNQFRSKGFHASSLPSPQMPHTAIGASRPQLSQLPFNIPTPNPWMEPWAMKHTCYYE